MKVRAGHGCPRRRGVSPGWGHLAIVSDAGFPDPIGPAHTALDAVPPGGVMSLLSPVPDGVSLVFAGVAVAQALKFM